MIVDTIESYLNLEELDSPATCSDVVDKLESTVTDIQSKQNEIQERFISLKTMTETLKDQILKEKDLWSNELQETIELERQLHEKHDCGSGDKFVLNEPVGYRKRFEMFKEFAYLSNANASKQLENHVRQNDYQQTLFDVETKCNMELLKIQHSITILKPLKEMAAKWTQRGQPESGDQIRKATENTEVIPKEDVIAEESDKEEVSDSGNRSIAEDDAGAWDTEDTENELIS